MLRFVSATLVFLAQPTRNVWLGLQALLIVQSELGFVLSVSKVLTAGIQAFPSASAMFVRRVRPTPSAFQEFLLLHFAYREAVSIVL
jgi:hypothetical protein